MESLAFRANLQFPRGDALVQLPRAETGRARTSGIEDGLKMRTPRMGDTPARTRATAIRLVPKSQSEPSHAAP